VKKWAHHHRVAKVAAHCHGSTTEIPQRSKSFTLRVARLALEARAIAAICASKAEIGRPARRRAVAMSA
jgi:hypothetical protein